MISRFFRIHFLLFLVGFLATVAVFNIVRADVPQLPGGLADDGSVDCG